MTKLDRLGSDSDLSDVIKKVNALLDILYPEQNPVPRTRMIKRLRDRYRVDGK